jgi:glycosyltransferase involved in cell wall biosynthesis
MTTLSTCIIIRNEEENLPDLLQNILPITDELIIVDTGSTDNSVNIIQNNEKIKVFHFEWCDDFSKARNFSLQQATCNWILVMDADERIASPETFRTQLSDDNFDAFYLSCQNLQPNDSLTKYEVDQLIRLFKNKPNYRFSGRIHEQISPSIKEAEGTVGFSKSVIIHGGYQNDSVQGNDSRRERNIRLLTIARNENPEDYYYVFQLAITVQSTEPERSYQLLRLALMMGGKDIPVHIRGQIKQKLAQLCIDKNDFSQAISNSQYCLRHNKENLIARVCLITSFISIQAYSLAMPHLEYVIQNALEQVPNPNDFLTLHSICTQQG